MTSARQLLGPGGPLAQQLAGYEIRDGQLEMTSAVERALDCNEILLCEAGTGTGKTLAYLIPAILSNKKIIISTATRALQEQLVLVDIPLVEKLLARPVSFAVMKGLSNYICRRRLGEHDLSAQANTRHTLATVTQFAETSKTGDIAELSGLAETDPIWREVTSSADTRRGSACSFYERCFVTRMRRQAEEARIVIVNHHLFFADLALRGPHPGRVLPNYDAVVFDEAHQLEDIATEFFGTRVTSSRLERLGQELERAFSTLASTDPTLGTQSGTAFTQELRTAARAYFDAHLRAAPGRDGRREVELEAIKGEPYDAWLRLDTALEVTADIAKNQSQRLPELRTPSNYRTLVTIGEQLEVLARRLQEQREALSVIAEDSTKRVIWVECSDRSCSVTSAPFDLSNLLRARIFESVPSVVLTSATLTTAPPSIADESNGSFQFLRERLGLFDLPSPVVELVVPSPFDYPARSLLYIPKDLPPPNDTTFTEVAGMRIAELIELTSGGAFVLTTSLRSMQKFHEALKERFKHLPVWIQGEAPKTELLQRFREHEGAVLVATSSFWEGVDVPGRALRLVVLEKIPFFVPADPLVRARSHALEQEGKNPFMEYLVPAAAITLKQGFGRLIRGRADAGIVALLDERLHRRGYGQRLLRSLPPARRTSDIEAVRQFWAKLSL